MERSLRAGRLATFAYFVLAGFVMGMWIVHIPVIEHRTGISHAVLGWLLLLLGAGAFGGMQLAGPLTDRFGARTVVPASAALCAAALVLPALATDVWTLGGALLVLGVGNGCLDVSMNAHAVQVERGYGRPVMSAFHALFSIGGVLAALIGAFTLGRGWSAAATTGGTALFCLVVAAVAAGALLRPDPASTAVVGASAQEVSAQEVSAGEVPAGEVSAGDAPARRGTPSRIWILAVLAFLLMLSEGVANDWSVLHVKDVLGAPASTAALAYGAFATAMTVGRLLADRVAARVGAAAVLRYGSGVGAVGLALAAFAPNVAVALVGWAVVGAGLSGCVPQLFSAAGHADPDAAGANVSRVAGLGYLGMLAGPAVIGPLTHAIPLNLTFLLPAAFCVAACLTARILEPGPATSPDSQVAPDSVENRTPASRPTAG
ncbi:MFS transporter [Streptomyces liangshanensis]|uniref:MFS transporter n=1 Tax=Streptomyces liangshanensis TaxID=2717324 RepID=A0A6G9H5Y4_9ACTN|nr:MFS transporter [Streptomyces liangshanensis]QIQ05945.1 MFS transporter [Streptomyces liangshanensis]